MNLTPRSFVRDAAALAVAAILLSGVVLAQDVAQDVAQKVAPVVPPAAAPAASPPPLAAEAPVAIETQPQDQLRAQVQALVAGTLDVAVTPQSLFEVLLSDEAAVQIEALRVRALLRERSGLSSRDSAGSGGQ